MQQTKGYFLRFTLFIKSSLGIINFKIFSLLSVLKVLGVISSVIIMAVVIKELEPKNVGVYFLVFALAKVFSLIFSLGSFAAIIPIYSSSNKDNAYHLVSLSIISSLIMALSIILSINLVFFFIPDAISSRYWYIPYASFLAAAITIQTNLFHIFSAQSRLIHATLLQEGTGRNIIILSLICFLIIFDNSLLGLRSIFTFTIVSSFLLVIYGLANLKFYLNIFRVPSNIAREFFKLGLNFAPSTALSNGSSHIIDIFVNYLFGPVALASIAIANRVCEVFLFFSHMINLYFVRASKIYFDGRVDELRSLYKRCILGSISSVLLMIICFILFGTSLANNFLGLDDIENADFAIKVMLLSTVGQSIAIFSLTLLRNIGRFKFVFVLDSINLILAFILLSIGFIYANPLYAIIIIVCLRLIRQLISLAYLTKLLSSEEINESNFLK